MRWLKHVAGAVGLAAGCLGMVSCGDGSPNPSAPTASAKPCYDVYHPKEVTAVGHNTFVVKDAWVEHICP